MTNANLTGIFDIEISGTYAYAVSATAGRLTVINIATPASPAQVGTVTSAQLAGADDLVLSGTYAYVAGRAANSIAVINITTPSSPTQA